MHRKSVLRARAGHGAAVASIALALFWGSAAAAQDTPSTTDASAESSANDSDTIIVTGSRIARSTFDTPSPVTVLGSEQLEQTQVTNIGEAVAEIPAFRPSNNPSTIGFGSFFCITKKRALRAGILLRGGRSFGLRSPGA